jgi:hypothetical protein
VEHYLEYWKLSVANPTKVLFLRYEEMMAEPARHVRMLAEFLGVAFTEEEKSGGVVEEVVRPCDFRNLMKDLPVNTHVLFAMLDTCYCIVVASRQPNVVVWDASKIEFI